MHKVVLLGVFLLNIFLFSRSVFAFDVPLIDYPVFIEPYSGEMYAFQVEQDSVLRFWHSNGRSPWQEGEILRHEPAEERSNTGANLPETQLQVRYGQGDMDEAQVVLSREDGLFRMQHRPMGVMVGLRSWALVTEGKPPFPTANNSSLPGKPREHDVLLMFLNHQADRLQLTNEEGEVLAEVVRSPYDMPPQLQLHFPDNPNLDGTLRFYTGSPEDDQLSFTYFMEENGRELGKTLTLSQTFGSHRLTFVFGETAPEGMPEELLLVERKN